MFKNILLLTLPSFLAVFLVLELIFTFIIPASQVPHYYYDSDDHILRFSTTEQREGVYTIGLLAQQRGKWTINNAGWNSAIDFEESKRKPRIAIIGDSYVEALQIDVGNSLAGQLRKMVYPHFDVYAFGTSGAPLSQYLQMTRYVRAHFDPDIIVITVVHNDFAESLCSVKRQAGMLCLEGNGIDLQEARISPYQPNQLFRMARQSSVARFLYINAKIGARLQRLMTSRASSEGYNANIDVDKVKSLNGRIREATAYVLSTMKRENAGKPVVFLMDAPRKDIYTGSLSESNLRWLHALLKEETARFGFTLVDLTEEFASAFKSEHAHFESEYDFHWNQKGHQVAAQALYDKLRTIRLFAHLWEEQSALQ